MLLNNASSTVKFTLSRTSSEHDHKCSVGTAVDWDGHYMLHATVLKRLKEVKKYLGENADKIYVAPSISVRISRFGYEMRIYLMTQLKLQSTGTEVIS